MPSEILYSEPGHLAIVFHLSAFFSGSRGLCGVVHKEPITR
jgi:hypothetical protein